jgi:hypothetical protein
MIFWLIALVVMAGWGGIPLFHDDLEVGRAALIPHGMDLLGLILGAKALIPILADPCLADCRHPFERGGQKKPL